MANLTMPLSAYTPHVNYYCVETWSNAYNAFMPLFDYPHATTLERALELARYQSTWDYVRIVKESTRESIWNSVDDN